MMGVKVWTLPFLPPTITYNFLVQLFNTKEDSLNNSNILDKLKFTTNWSIGSIIAPA